MKTLALLLSVAVMSTTLGAAEPEKGDKNQASGAENVFRAEYVSGHVGSKRPFYGQLAWDSATIRVIDTDGRKPKVKFEIPLAAVRDVKASTEHESRVGLTSWHELHDQEYLILTIESGDTAEAIVFKVRRHESVNIAAKLEYARRRAVATAPESPK